MSSLIYTYALIKSLYEQGNDYIDSFWPFVIRVFPRNKTVDLQSIQHELKEQLKLDVPFRNFSANLTSSRLHNYIWRCL